MKNLVFIAGFISLFVPNLFAFDTCRESTASMTIDKISRRGNKEFDGLLGKQACLTIRECGNDSISAQIILTYEKNGTAIVKTLEVSRENNIFDDCGCAEYIAQLAENDEQNRFTVDLVTHNASCKSPHRWMANVASGQGFCGTMDAEMQMSGGPQ